jgi:hypothetical protein
LPAFSFRAAALFADSVFSRQPPALFLHYQLMPSVIATLRCLIRHAASRREVLRDAVDTMSLEFSAEAIKLY